MTTIFKAKFEGKPAAIEVVVSNSPGLAYEACDGGAWFWGAPLELDETTEDRRETLDAFCRKANMLIALSNPALAGIMSTGAMKIIRNGRANYVMLAEPGTIEIAPYPATVSVTGRTPNGPPPRPLIERAAELAAREPRFERAANILSECGEDPVKLYMVMELIERAHGGLPDKNKRPIERGGFFRRIEVEARDWEALHRSARPFRHAEPHVDDGPVAAPRQARYLIQHALKLWLAREVPK